MPLSYSEQGHEYRFNGRVIRSVTQTLGDARLVEIPHFGDGRVVRKRLLGRQVHNLCCLVDQGKIDWSDVDSDAMPFVRAYESFVCAGWLASAVEILASEEMVEIRVGDKVIGGRLDRKMLIRGEPYIIDLKTPAVGQPHWAIQIAGYELGSERPRRRPWRWKRAALRLGSDGRPHLITYTDPVDFDVFRAAVMDPEHPAVLRWKRNNNIAIEEEEE